MLSPDDVTALKLSKNYIVSSFVIFFTVLSVVKLTMSELKSQERHHKWNETRLVLWCKKGLIGCFCNHLINRMQFSWSKNNLYLVVSRNELTQCEPNFNCNSWALSLLRNLWYRYRSFIEPVYGQLARYIHFYLIRNKNSLVKWRCLQRK